MTVEALEGEETSFYPGSRSVDRPGTLVPADGESSAVVVHSLEEESRRLHELWSGLSTAQWETEITEPKSNLDLGGIRLGVLAVLRLTEVEVHGVDLDLDLPDWSDVFVQAALPVRLAMLATRRRGTARIDPEIGGSWLLVASDGPSWVVSLKGGRVTSEPWDGEVETEAAIHGTSRDILATLLGRPKGQMVMAGNKELAASFVEAFPGP
jgi:hypothetical protein